MNNKSQIVFFLRLGLLLTLLFFLLSASAISSFDNITETDLSHEQQQFQQQLELEDQHLIILKQSTERLAEQKAHQWQLILSRGITKQDLNNANLALANSLSTYNNISIALSSTNAELSTTLEAEQSFIQEHSQPTSAPKMNQVQQLWQLRGMLQSIINTQKKLIATLIEEQKISDKQVALIQRWYDQINQLYNYHFKQTTQLNLTLSNAKLQDQNVILIHTLALYSQQLLGIQPKDLVAQQQQADLEFKILIIREKITINQVALLLLKLRNYFHPNFIIDPQQITLFQLEQKLTAVNQTASQLNSVINQLNAKLIFIAKQKQSMLALSTVKAQDYNRALTEVYQSYQAQLVIASDFERDMIEYRNQIVNIKNTQLSIRQQLPGLSLAGWINLLYQLVSVPIFITHSLEATALDLIFHFKLNPTFKSYTVLLIIVLLFLVWFFLRKSFLRLLKSLADNSKQFSHQVLTITLQLLSKSLGKLLLLCGLFVIKLALDIDFTLLVSIIFIYLVFSLMITLARTWLLESEEDVAGSDVRLYHGLKWIFVLTGIFSIVMVVTHTFPAGYEVRVFCNKILMLLLLSLSILLFRSWSVLPLLIQKIFSVRRVYVMRAIHLVCVVVPLTFLTNALIGLLGYVQLAWLIGEYQVIALLTLTLYMIVRGLVIDATDFIYRILVSYSQSGWLLTQIFIKPLEHITRIALFIGAIIVFIYWSGVNQNITLKHYWHQLMHIPLINLFGNIITAPILIESVIIIATLYWFAKWSREFAFRWLYAKARDIGLRNSLAIFTQYAVVMVGIIVALRVLGFDLTGFAVVAAAFAAGIGISLRDVATNFISGILLLVERPFRTGDTISLGEYEGEVVSTGIRSMKIRTWDRMEVIVPNAEMFSKPFVNWTHQDSIVRSVVRLKVNRIDDPHRVQKLLLDLFKEISSVAVDPSPEVYMKELDGVLIEFEIRYFINLQIEDSRPRVRSKVLFAIWDCFLHHGIHSPDPGYTIRLLQEAKERKNEDTSMCGKMIECTDESG